MATHNNRPLKPKPRSKSRILILSVSAATIAFLCILSSSISSAKKLVRVAASEKSYYKDHNLEKKYIYWGKKIDCPGKHCDSCEGLGHQESSLRCALEEAMFLQRTFVMPSRMCINPIHNKKGILHQSVNGSFEERWEASSCSMDSLYDLELISKTVPVILDNSKMWYRVLSTSMKLGTRGVAHVEGIDRVNLKEDARYSNLLMINRTASPLSWFMECKDRKNHSAVALPYSFLPAMAAKKLRDAAEQIKDLLGEYDAIHVRRGDKIKTEKTDLELLEAFTLIWTGIPTQNLFFIE
ncbi:hypothetical protein Sjap_012909 [Stephania japonica]|uniref:O-fucosyltransferase family protein n=1 Tax=Stephania japonica TaxID=461633 RepID=A0AAP0NX85_9MAGN